ncbi:MAG: tRNA (guanosine(46)-N7)-methyltransferase TrmB [Bacteroidales bacterium]
MSKNKHRKFAEINSFPNVIQPEYKYPVFEHPMKGRWGERFFHNDHPVILEIGCGKGEYTTGLATAFPENNYIGIDIKGDRIWTGARYALQNALSNVAFLRIQAEHMHCFFAENEVDAIWITFPDPQLNKPRIRKRLTSPRFLDLYRKFLKKSSPVYLKTDNQFFYDFTLEVIQEKNLTLESATRDLYNDKEIRGKIDPVLFSIQTYYENMFIKEGKPICFLKFML